MKIGHLDIPEDATHHGTGLASWKNPINGFQILTTHYTADPEKRSHGWQKMASTGYTQAAWNQEYEMSFKTWAGRACYPGFSDQYHIFKKVRGADGKERGLAWNRQRHMCRGWDIGVHACVWAQRMNGRLSVYTARIVSGAFGQDENPVRYKEWEVPVSGLRVFIDHCVQLSDEMFPGAQWRDFVDPAAWHDTMKRQGDKPALEFEKAGLVPEPGVTQDIALRISGVENWLSRMTEKHPSFQVDEGELLLIDALSGGYQYGKEGTDKKPSKNGHSHSMDALQYLCGHMSAPEPGIPYADPEDQRLTDHIDMAKYDVGARTFMGRGGALEHQVEPQAWDDY